ncbi:hypothetical protein [Bacteroides sp.]|uniref:hypothetical protein n=1 Tax=Bacteroides sp. TaxID=29523 RepID=UPI0025C70DA1|nr:hypothetical protein [Bacteroides sp.]
MKHLVITIMLLLTVDLLGQVRHLEDLPRDILEQLDKMGIDDVPLLNYHESTYLNMVFEKKRKDFDFTEKKIAFFGPGGLVFSDKQKYFDNSKKNKRIIQSDLHVFNKSEKEESGGYDAVITYWCKRIYSSKNLLKKLKEKR